MSSGAVVVALLSQFNMPAAPSVPVSPEPRVAITASANREPRPSKEKETGVKYGRPDNVPVPNTAGRSNRPEERGARARLC